MSEIIHFFYKNITIDSCNFVQFAIVCNKFVCKVLTDLLRRFFFRKLIYMYVIQCGMSEIIDVFNINIGSCKFMQLATFCC